MTTNSGTRTQSHGSAAVCGRSKALQQSHRREATRYPNQDTGHGRHEALTHHEPHDVLSVGAERYAYPDFMRALLHRVRHQSVDPDRRQRQRDSAIPGA